MRTKPNFKLLWIAFKALFFPLPPALMGYGMFWWYEQPFNTDFPVGFSIMVGCYIAALGGYHLGKN